MLTAQVPPPQEIVSGKKEKIVAWKAGKKKIMCDFIYKDTFAESVKNSIVTTAGIVAGSLPVYATLETYVAGMTSEESIFTRWAAATSGLFGLNTIYKWGRELAYIDMEVGESSTGPEKQSADMKYQVLFSLMTYPVMSSIGRWCLEHPIYISQTAGETLKIAAMGALAGPFVGKCLDVYNELCGVSFSSRVPERVRKWPKVAKVGLAVALSAASLGAAKAIYDGHRHYESQYAEGP